MFQKLTCWREMVMLNFVGERMGWSTAHYKRLKRQNYGLFYSYNS